MVPFNWLFAVILTIILFPPPGMSNVACEADSDTPGPVS